MSFTFSIGDLVVIATVLFGVGMNWQKVNYLLEAFKRHVEKDHHEINECLKDVDKRVTVLETMQEKA
jgi:hypothetical protein